MNSVIEESSHKVGVSARALTPEDAAASGTTSSRAPGHSKSPSALDIRTPRSTLEKAATIKQRPRRNRLPCQRSSTSPTAPDRLDAMLNHAHQEALALAATTTFPDLFLPCLLEEKTHQARAYAARQEQVWESSRDILCMAV